MGKGTIKMEWREPLGLVEFGPLVFGGKDATLCFHESVHHLSDMYLWLMSDERDPLVDAGLTLQLTINESRLMNRRVITGIHIRKYLFIT